MEDKSKCPANFSLQDFNGQGYSEACAKNWIIEGNEKIYEPYFNDHGYDFLSNVKSMF